MDSALHCPTCGYNLTGLSENRCPECGAAFSRDHLIYELAARRPLYKTELLLQAAGPVGCAWLIMAAIAFFVRIGQPGMVVLLAIGMGMDVAVMAWAAWCMSRRVLTYIWFVRYHRSPPVGFGLAKVAIAILVYVCQLAITVAPLLIL